MRRITVVAAATVACVALCAPVLASGAVTIGGDVSTPGSPEPCGAAACEVAQISLANGQTVAPFDGVVVRWRVNGSTGRLALRVLRTAGPSDYAFVSTSVYEMPATKGLETFATRQPIRAGDYVGVELGSIDAAIGWRNSGPAGDVLAAWSFVPDGRAAPPVAYGPRWTFAYNADVEPDADHDGYGDETQDQCPTDPSTQGACPPPPAAPAPAGAASAPAADRTPVRLTSLARSTRLTKGGAIAFVVTASEQATSTARGTIRLPGHRTVHLAKRRIALRAALPTTVTLRLSRASAALVRRALARHAPLKARITLSVADTAGNASATHLALRLLRT
jgi:hypothetical protein